MLSPFFWLPDQKRDFHAHILGTLPLRHTGGTSPQGRPRGGSVCALRLLRMRTPGAAVETCRVPNMCRGASSSPGGQQPNGSVFRAFFLGVSRLELSLGRFAHQGAVVAAPGGTRSIALPFCVLAICAGYSRSLLRGSWCVPLGAAFLPALQGGDCQATTVARRGRGRLRPYE